MSYRPPESFMTRLKELDPKLGCKFSPRAKVCIITYEMPVGEPITLMRVEDDEGNFRIPDQRDLDALHKSDNTRHSREERNLAAAKYMSDYRENRKRIVHGEIKGRTADDKYQLARAFAQVHNGASGKVGQHVRRITPKPKGKVF